MAGVSLGCFLRGGEDAAGGTTYPYGGEDILKFVYEGDKTGVIHVDAAEEQVSQVYSACVGFGATGGYKLGGGLFGGGVDLRSWVDGHSRRLKWGVSKAERSVRAGFLLR